MRYCVASSQITGEVLDYNCDVYDRGCISGTSNLNAYTAGCDAGASAIQYRLTGNHLCTGLLRYFEAEKYGSRDKWIARAVMARAMLISYPQEQCIVIHLRMERFSCNTDSLLIFY